MEIADSALIIDCAIEEKMQERGIQKADVKEVLASAEEGERLYIEGENHFLGKKRLENFTVYVEYEKENEGYRILDVYSHRVALAEDQK